MGQEIILDASVSKENIDIGKRYNKIALEGLLNFLEAIYEDLLGDIDKGLEPLEAIKSELSEVKKLRKIWLD